MGDRYLFKAKRLDNGEWVKGALVYDDMDKLYRIITEIDYSTGTCMTTDKAPRVNASTICQCTGLKDKNGKLIWENDAVDFFGHKGVIVCECGSFGIAYKTFIDWEEIQSNIKCVTGCENILYACENDNYISLWEIYWNFNDEDDSVNTVEVIGNIFDNKELLESER